MEPLLFRPVKTGKRVKTRKPRINRGFLFCERYWDRTSDLFRVREARYRCANRSCFFSIVDSVTTCGVTLSEVATGFEPVWTALQAAASPLGHATVWWYSGPGFPGPDFHSSG